MKKKLKRKLNDIIFYLGLISFIQFLLVIIVIYLLGKY